MPPKTTSWRAVFPEVSLDALGAEPSRPRGLQQYWTSWHALGRVGRRHRDSRRPHRHRRACPLRGLPSVALAETGSTVVGAGFALHFHAALQHGAIIDAYPLRNDFPLDQALGVHLEQV